MIDLSDIDVYCDHTDRQVLELSRHLMDQVAPCPSTQCIDWEKDYAIVAFRWVRDNIKYRVLHDWTVPVSYTLQQRHGNCGTKACLLVALLRAVGMEAEFCVERIDTAGTFFFVPTSITSKCNGKSIHFSSAVMIQGTWYHIDATTDWKLAKGMSGVAGSTFQVVFDGASHAVAGGHVGFQEGVQRMDSIATYMSKKSRVTPAVRECFNLAADFCRRKGHLYPTAQSLSQDAETYILKNYTATFSQAFMFISDNNNNKTKTTPTAHAAPPRASPASKFTVATSSAHSPATELSCRAR